MIEFELQDFYINSGIIGLYQMLSILDEEEKYIRKENTKLMIDKDWLLSLDLTEVYFNALIKKYEHICPLTRTINQLEMLSNDKIDSSKVKGTITTIEKSLSKKHIKEGINIIKDSLPFDFDEDLKDFKKSDEKNLINNTKKLIYDLENRNLKEMLIIKNIGIFVVSYFWKNVSFLNKNDKITKPKDAFRKYFENPLKEFLNQEAKGKEYCVECGFPINSDSKKITSFVNSLTEDFKKKNSNYWNFKPNCYVCPKCNFLFACMPLGFLPFGKNYVFINNNESLKTLINANEESLLSKEKLSYYQEYNRVIHNLSNEKIKELKFLEVITNEPERERYKFDIISKNILEKLKRQEINLEKLSKRGILKTSGGSINIYDEVMDRIINNRSLYPLIHQLLLISLKETDNAKTYCYRIYKIEEGEKNMKEENYENIIEAGRRYNMKLAQKESGRIESLCYDMLRMISTNKGEELFDLIVRLSNITGELIPKEMYEMITNKEKIKPIGYAFVLGFRNGKEEN